MRSARIADDRTLWVETKSICVRSDRLFDRERPIRNKTAYWIFQMTSAAGQILLTNFFFNLKSSFEEIYKFFLHNTMFAYAHKTSKYSLELLVKSMTALSKSWTRLATNFWTWWSSSGLIWNFITIPFRNHWNSSEHALRISSMGHSSK